MAPRGYKVERFDETPNPNALKCVLDREIQPNPRSYRRREDLTSEDPLATSLFAIPGVTGLLIGSGWITVNKDPAAAWPSIKPAIEKALRNV